MASASGRASCGDIRALSRRLQRARAVSPPLPPSQHALPTIATSRRASAGASLAAAAVRSPLGAAAGCSDAADRRARQRAASCPRRASQLFTRLPSSATGVRFENRLAETRELNVFTYRNFYNGGGVAIGDLTGDGLPEIVLTSNQGGPRLYLNRGEFRFRDVTDARRADERTRRRGRPASRSPT